MDNGFVLLYITLSYVSITSYNWYYVNFYNFNLLNCWWNKLIIITTLLFNLTIYSELYLIYLKRLMHYIMYNT